MKSLKQAALSGARWTLAARIGLQLVTWPITIFVMRELDPGNYGVFAIAMVAHGFITLFAELGLGVALVQAPEVSPAQARMAATLVLGLNAIIALVIIAVAPWIALEYREPDVTGVMWALTAELGFAALAAVPMAMLERGLRFRAISLAQIAGGVTGAFVTLGMALSDAGVWSLVGGALTNAGVRSLGWLIAHGGPVWPGRVQVDGIRPMVRVSSHAVFSRMLWFWSGQADSLILGLQLQAQALGAYNVSAQLAMLPAGKAMEAVNRVAFPVLCRFRDEATHLLSFVTRLRALLALYGFGVCWGLAAVAPEFVQLVLGPKWGDAQLPLAALAFVAPLRMLSAFQNTVVTAAGRPEAATRELLFASVLLPVSIGLGAWWGGLYGAALAWPLAYPLVYALSVGLTSAAIRQRWWDAVAPSLMPVAAGVVMVMSIWLCRRAVGTELPLAALLALEIVLGALAYLTVLWFGARPLLEDTRDLVLDLVRPKAA